MRIFFVVVVAVVVVVVGFAVSTLRTNSPTFPVVVGVNNVHESSQRKRERKTRNISRTVGHL